MNISVIIIAKNAETLIDEAIVSAQQLSPVEILVLDDASTDETKARAKKLGAKVIAYQKKDFSDIRNFGMQKAKSEWLLYLDTDERISAELALELKNTLPQLSPHVGAVSFARVNYYLGKKWPTPETVTRLIRRKNLKHWQGTLHESPVISGEIKKIGLAMTHYTHRSISEMVVKTIVWSRIEAELRFQNNHPPITWWRLPRVMMPVFFDYYIRQGGWKVGTVGLIESIYQSFSIFITYARLWELQQGDGKTMRR